MLKRAVIPVSLTVAVLAAVPSSQARRRVIERIIVRVNNEIITQRQYEREKEKLRQQLARQYSGQALETQMREESKNLLRDLIDQALMVQKARDLDINVETDVIKQLDEIRENLKFGSLETLQREVEKEGILWEDFQDNIRRSLLVREVMGREVGRTVIVSREDARKFFEEHKQEFSSPGGVHLAQILIASGDLSPEAVEKKAKDAIEELKAGQRWTDVVNKYSDDKTTARDGGAIGFLKEEQLAPAIAEKVAKLEFNEFTEEPIKVTSGLLILKLLERRSPGIPPFEEVEQRVMEHIYNQKMAPALRQFLVTLRKESYIYLAPGYVDTGAERPSDALVAKSSP